MRTNSNTGRKKSTLKILALTSTALVGFALTPSAQAQEWKGSTDGNWMDATNWNPAQVPTASDDVTIDNPAGQDARLVGVGKDGVAHNITIAKTAAGDGNALYIEDGATLTSNQGIIGDQAGSNGFVDVGGIGIAPDLAKWTNSGSLIIGNSGFGGLNIVNGTVGNKDATIGANASGMGGVTVNGANAAWTNSGFLTVGGAGSGTLNILNGGKVSNTFSIVGNLSGAHGNVVVSGAGSTWTNANTLTVGNEGDGTLNVSAGAVVTTSGLIVGASTGGVVTVDGAGSRLSASGASTIGRLESGTLNVKNGGVVETASTLLGQFDGGNSIAQVFVDGTGSKWTNTAQIIVGLNGDAHLSVTNGGKVTNTFGVIADLATSTSSVDVSGAGSTWTSTGTLTVGNEGKASLDVSAGGVVTTTGLIVGASNGSGVMTIDGIGSKVSASGASTIGRVENGKLAVTNGAVLETGSTLIGQFDGGQGSIAEVLIAGVGSSWANSSDLTVGLNGDAALKITKGGTVSNLQGTIGAVAGSDGVVTVDGAGSTWTSGLLFVGDNGDATLNITHGGSVADASAFAAVSGDASTATINVDGAGSSWISGGATVLGVNGKATLNVTNGGYVATGAAVANTMGILGSAANSKGTAIIDGTGSAWDVKGQLWIGSSGNGDLTLSNGGTVTAADGIKIGVNAGSTGHLTIGAGGGTVFASSVSFEAGTGTLNFDQTNAAGIYTFSTGISGLGTINQFSGQTHLTGDSSGFIGTTKVQGGGLFVDNVLGGSVVAYNGVVVGGQGTVLGDVFIGGGATLQGIQGQTLTAGYLDLRNGSIIDATFSDAGGPPLFVSLNGLTLDGTINLTANGAFGPGVYSLMLYGGALTDNGLDIGATPSGTTTNDFAVQTSVAGQVNLVNTALPNLAFWDGDAAGSANNGAVDGGSGIWSATSPNWTDMNGTVNGVLHPQPSFAIFQGAAGTVTADASAGDIAVTGMQFASEGYQLTGAPITLADANSIIRVGDGSAAGAQFKATISSVLTGMGGLNKADLGTLILTGNNDYAGGTTISGGTLQLGNGGTSGSIAGDILNKGMLVFNRADAVTFAGSISGNGAIEQIGAGTTTLTGNSSAFTGSVTVNGGGLSVTGGGMLASGGFVAAGSTGDSGAVVVTGAGSVLTSSGFGAIGYRGAGTLSVTNGASVSNNDGVLGWFAGSSGSAAIDGTGSTWSSTGALTVGRDGTGTLAITNGGAVSSARGYVGLEAGSTGQVTVNGGGSRWTTMSLTVGGRGAGALNVLGGGAVTSSDAALGSFAGATGNATVDGAGSAWTNAGDFAVGYAGSGTLAITNGGKVSDANAFVGALAGSTGKVTVDGAGSSWINVNLVVGGSGGGMLTIANNGAVSTSGAFVLAGEAGSSGVLNIGAASGSSAGGAGTLNAASLQFGSGTGVVNFNHTSTNYAFSTNMAGAGTINQLAGNTNLTGSSNGFIGAVNVNGGRLAVNGFLAGGQVTVGNGATLGGNGIIGGLTAQSGSIIAPGNSIGTLNVAGNASFASGSIYQVELNGLGQSDLINVGGAVNIANGAQLSVIKIDAVPYVLGTHYNIIKAGGALTGGFSFDTIKLTNFMGLVVGADAHSVYLDVAKIKTFGAAGLTANEKATGLGLDSLPLSSVLVGAVANLPNDAAAQGAFNQLSGEIHASMASGMIEDSRIVRESMLDRLRGTIDAVPGTSDGSVSVWGRGFGQRSRLKGDGNAASIKHDDSGILMGADGMVGSNVRVGFVGGYSHSTFNDAGRNSHGESDNYHVGAYGGAQLGQLSLRTGVGYTLHDVTTTRTVGFAGFSDALSSDYQARTTQAFGEIAYALPVGKAMIEPFANLAYVDQSSNRFTEKGGLAALTGKGGQTSVTFSTVGLRGVSQFDLGGGTTVKLRGSAGWRHAFGDVTADAPMTFANGTSFSIAGVSVTREAAVVDLGADVNLSEKTTIGLSYGGQFGSGSSSNSVRATLAVKF